MQRRRLIALTMAVVLGLAACSSADGPNPGEEGSAETTLSPGTSATPSTTAAPANESPVTTTATATTSAEATTAAPAPPPDRGGEIVAMASGTFVGDTRLYVLATVSEPFPSTVEPFVLTYKLTLHDDDGGSFGGTWTYHRGDESVMSFCEGADFCESDGTFATFFGVAFNVDEILFSFPGLEGDLTYTGEFVIQADPTGIPSDPLIFDDNGEPIVFDRTTRDPTEAG